jgi:hypothetical protein
LWGHSIYRAFERKGRPPLGLKNKVGLMYRRTTRIAIREGWRCGDAAGKQALDESERGCFGPKQCCLDWPLSTLRRLEHEISDFVNTIPI